MCLSHFPIFLFSEMSSVEEVYHRPKGTAKGLHRLLIRRDEFKDDQVIPERKPFLKRLKKIEQAIKVPVYYSGAVKTLYKTCLEFVATYADCLDSLVGFPEVVASDVWKTCYDKLCLPGKYTCLTLATFCVAYPTLILPECQIVDNLHLINNYEHELCSVLSHVVHLDLSGCHLGDDHDILRAFKDMSVLQSLGLANNNLSSKALRVAFGQLSPVNKRLEYFDVSSNPRVTVQGIKVYLVQPSAESFLQRLVVSVSHGDVEMYDRVLEPYMQRKSRPDLLTVDSQGWAKSLLDSWAERMKEREHKKLSRVATKDAAKRFYGQKNPNTNIPYSSSLPTCQVYMYEKKRKQLKKPTTIEHLLQNKQQQDGEGEEDILAMYK